MTWDERFMRIAIEARSWVKGPDLGVGAVVVSPDRRRLSIGYSGLPRGMDVPDHIMSDPSFKDRYMVHAELNAILNAGCSLTGWTIYATTCMCSKCAAYAVQAGIARAVMPRPQKTSRWTTSQRAGVNLLQQAGVTLEFGDEA